MTHPLLELANSGFPRRGVPTPKFGTPTYYYLNFFGRKLHGNERIWTEEGSRIPSELLDSTLENH